MDSQPMTFRMGTIGQRGMVIFDQPGLDLVRSLLLLWIQECERSEDRAKQFQTGFERSLGNKASEYYRNARSFMIHLLTCRLKERVKLSDQLRWVARWREECDLPPGWIELVKLDTEMGEEIGTDRPSACGCGTCGSRGCLTTGMATGQRGAVVSASPDLDPPGGDTRSGVGTDGPTADDDGKAGASPDRRRGGQRDPKGFTSAKGRSVGKPRGKRATSAGDGEQGRE